MYAVARASPVRAGGSRILKTVVKADENGVDGQKPN